MKILGLVFKVAIGLVFGTLLLLALALGYRAYRQHEIAPLLIHTTPNAISDGRYVVIGGIKQWIQIRGEDRGNPVIVFVHGGPGDAQSGLSALYRAWEHDFTIVQWDHRGAGRTYSVNGPVTPDLTMDRLAQDGVEVVEYVRRTLHVERVILVGHSWGSVIGVNIVKKRPDLFYAYVGTGQFAAWPDVLQENYVETLAAAKARHAIADVKTLQDLGPPPYDPPERYLILRNLRRAYLAKADSHFITRADRNSISGIMFDSPELPLPDMISSIYAMSAGNAYPALTTADLNRLGYDFPIPVFIFEGRDDRITGAQNARAYFEKIKAPQKEFLWLDGGHFAVMTNEPQFLAALKRDVRPLAVPR